MDPFARHLVPALDRGGKRPLELGGQVDPADNDVQVTFAEPGGGHVTVPAFWDSDRWRVKQPNRSGHCGARLSGQLGQCSLARPGKAENQACRFDHAGEPVVRHVLRHISGC